MHKFSPEHWLRLENEDRRRLIPPASTLKKFGLSQGMTFVDVGAGTGFFSREASTIVGKGGKVFAAEMSHEMIDILKQQGVPPEVEVIHSDEYSIPLPDSVADLTWLAFVTHENPDVPRFLREAARVTKQNGRIIVVEWKKQNEERGPAMEERLAQDILLEQLKGFNVIRDGSLNPSHYYVEIEVQKPK
ncbi:MAG: class I SAM-dependent methyltransferase [Bacteroidota bacterium]|jgi:ubiquinone/menaquinone biosynthesis C-methylase UbiE